MGTMQDLSINNYIETIIAADGDEAKIRATMVTPPFVVAKSIRLPTGWQTVRSEGMGWRVWSPDGHSFESKSSAMTFIDSLVVISLANLRIKSAMRCP